MSDVTFFQSNYITSITSECKYLLILQCLIIYAIWVKSDRKYIFFFWTVYKSNTEKEIQSLYVMKRLNLGLYYFNGYLDFQ